jgi:hypothetical protein
LAGVSVETGNRRDIHHFADHRVSQFPLSFCRCAQPVGRCSQYAKWRNNVNVEHGLELLVRGLLNDAVPGVTRIVNQYVYRAKGVQRRLNHLVRESRPREITFDGTGRASVCCNKVLCSSQSRGIHVIENSVGARLR